MNCNELKDEVLDSIINANAWNEISSSFGLNEGMLEKYADKLNWHEVSQNTEIHWTVKLLEKWADRLDWEKLSDSANDYLLTPDVIAYFVNRWNWHKLSGNHNLKLNNLFIDRFVDYWDWEELINGFFRGEELYNRDFYDRYRKYIPMHPFLNRSNLLEELQRQEVEHLKKELTSHC